MNKSQLDEVLELIERRERISQAINHIHSERLIDVGAEISRSGKWVGCLRDRLRLALAPIDTKLQELTGYEPPSEPEPFDDERPL